MTERKFRGAAARRRHTPAPRQRAVSAQARGPLSSAPLLPVPRRQRPLGPMSRRALRRLRGEQRGQEPLGPDALQFVLRDDDDAEEGPKRGPGGRRPRDAGKEGVRVNNRFELVRSGAAWGGGSAQDGSAPGEAVTSRGGATGVWAAAGRRGEWSGRWREVMGAWQWAGSRRLRPCRGAGP